MRVFLYSHGGSGNHGCEAIVRGTKAILIDEKLRLYSNSINEDQKYGLDKIVELCHARKKYKKMNIKRIAAALQIHLFHKENYATKISIAHILKQYGKGDIGLSIGGDNYCYPGFEEYGIINNMIRQRGIKTVLWGCSVEESMINDIMKKDLLAYDLIVARESITYETMKKIHAKVILCPDPAFQLMKQMCDIPFGKNEKKTIGINISPHIMRCEKENNIAYENYAELIRYILEKTDYQIALIPHVVWKNNDDRTVNENLYKDFKNDKRIFVIEDHTCEELKYIISKCDMFVGARTHATIAAYSSCIPTLVVGYSVKARGIAKDIFGTEKNYVIPVQTLNKNTDLTEAFKWLEINKKEIKCYLKKVMPKYIEDGIKVRNSILRL